MSNSVVVVVAGEDKTGQVFDAVNKHLTETRKRAETETKAMA